MSDDRMSMSKRVSYEVVVSHLKKRIHGSRFVSLSSNPSADCAECWQHRGVGFNKESCSTVHNPAGKFIGPGSDFITDLFDAEDPSGCIGRNQPIPECGTEIEAIVEILGLNEDIRI